MGLIIPLFICTKLGGIMTRRTVYFYDIFPAHPFLNGFYIWACQAIRLFNYVILKYFLFRTKLDKNQIFNENQLVTRPLSPVVLIYSSSVSLIKFLFFLFSAITSIGHNVYYIFFNNI